MEIDWMIVGSVILIVTVIGISWLAHQALEEFDRLFNYKGRY